MLNSITNQFPCLDSHYLTSQSTENNTFKSGDRTILRSLLFEPSNLKKRKVFSTKKMRNYPTLHKYSGARRDRRGKSHSYGIVAIECGEGVGSYKKPVPSDFSGSKKVFRGEKLKKSIFRTTDRRLRKNTFNSATI